MTTDDIIDVSIVIRTYNEQRWLGDTLAACRSQAVGALTCEVVVVDSGSTDKTVVVASANGCRLVHISKGEFTFGRSLNVGCQVARGRILVFISGHCIPVGQNWLVDLIRPLEAGQCHFVYGRQVGLPGVTKFSEEQIFRKYFPERRDIPQVGFFCNNANSAVLRRVWQDYRFDESVTGLEDMEFAKRLVSDGLTIGYAAEAQVVHVHEESWSKVKTRYEREAVALQRIMPEVYIRFFDFVRYFLVGVLYDWSEALGRRIFWREALGVVLFRLMQYWGAYRGNNDHRTLSDRRKDRYFYPR